MPPENLSCQTADDCTALHDKGNSCDCEPSLTFNGVAVNAAGATEAHTLLNRFWSAECAAFRASAAPKECDVAPANNLRCENNRCRVTAQTCSF